MPNLGECEYLIFEKAILSSENIDINSPKAEKIIKRAVIIHSPENICMIIFGAVMKEAA